MNKLLFDLLPVILFFVAYKVADIYVATGMAIAASVLQIVWLLLKKRPIQVMQWVGLGIIVVFGGLTLMLQDEAFIKWKPTILYWSFGAGVLLASLLGRNPVQHLMGGQVELPDRVWKVLNRLWLCFFLLMGAVNLKVAYAFSTEVWVNFKLFGTTALTLIFIVAQGFYLSRYIEEDDDRETKS
ncbi:MAG: septation protein A [Lautropia sp.]|nr:septation protein A [Lautropia sp.]